MKTNTEYKQCDGSTIGTANNKKWWLICRCSGSYKWVGMMSCRIRAWIGLGCYERVCYDGVTPEDAFADHSVYSDLVSCFPATHVFMLLLFFSGPTNSTNSTVTAGSNIVYSIGVVGFSLILLLLVVVLVLLLTSAMCLIFPSGSHRRYWTLKEKISQALQGQWTYRNTSSKIIAHTESLTCIITLLI